MKRNFYIFILSLFSVIAYSQTYSSFKSFNDLPVDTFWNGNDLSGGFVDGELEFPCIYDTSWGGFWSSGWAISTMTDDTTVGSKNLYGIRTHARIDDSPFAIGQNHSYFNTKDEEKVLFEGLYVTNTTYAYLSMKNGDSFAKKFGGSTGKDPDFFKLRVYAVFDQTIDSSNFVDFYLADFRSDQDSLDYIVDDWWYMDLSSLGFVDGLNFELTSSDIGQWGMNTPAFFAVDKIKYSYEYDSSSPSVGYCSFEENNIGLDSFWYGENADSYFYSGGFQFPSVYDTSYGGYWKSGFALSSIRDDLTSGFDNLYGCIAGGSYDGTTYVIGQNNSQFRWALLDESPVIKSIKITNTTYAYYSMKNGDAFAKKFGGDSGDDPDYFKLRIYGLSSTDVDEIDSTKYYDFYLADYRFDDNSNDYILDDWVEINIDSIFDFDVSGLAFELFSSDNSPWGMNTPAFFAIDRIEYDIRSGIDEKNANISVNVYPNPASEYIKIDVDNIDKQLNYELIDISGKKLTIGTVRDMKEINIEQLSTGTYFIKVYDNNSRVVKKVIVNR